MNESLKHFDIAQIRKIQDMEANIRQILRSLKIPEKKHSCSSSLSSLTISRSLLNDSCSQDAECIQNRIAKIESKCSDSKKSAKEGCATTLRTKSQIQLTQQDIFKEDRCDESG